MNLEFDLFDFFIAQWWEVGGKKKEFCKVKCKNSSRRSGTRRLQQMMMYLGMYSYCWEKMV